MIQFDLRIVETQPAPNSTEHHRTNNTVDASEIWESLRLVAAIPTILKRILIDI